MDIRTARPTDQGHIAALLYSAGPELYDYIYTTPRHSALDYIEHEFRSGRGFCGHRNVTVAVQNGEVVATAGFYGRDRHDRLAVGSLLNMFRFYGLRDVWPVLRRAGHVDSVMKKPAPDELYLSNFGVAPERRGTGIGRQIIEHQLQAAAQRGYRRLVLDVADTNPRAERLYTRLGFELVCTKRFSGGRPGLAVPNARQMAKTLRPA